MKASTKWRNGATIPTKSGYFLCWNKFYGRPFVAWFDANNRRFDTKKEVAFWAGVNEPSPLSTKPIDAIGSDND